MIKYSELFLSLQGEGRYVGVPSVFLRMFGCNFRCPGFGVDHHPPRTPNKEVLEIISETDFKRIASIKQLPLAKTGCDSYASIYPEFKHLYPSKSIDEVATDISNLLNGKVFDKNLHLILTGGEPMLFGWQRQYDKLIEALNYYGLIDGTLHVTIETNGTQPIQNTLKLENTKLHFSVSPKLSASGEERETAIIEDVVMNYLLKCDVLDLKFVVSKEKDIDEVRHILNCEYRNVIKHPKFGTVFLMPVGGTKEEYRQNARKVADLALKHRCAYSPRLQCELYDNDWGT